MDSDNVGWWIPNVEGTSRQRGSGVSLQLKPPTGEMIEQAILLDFPASNNQAKYKAILDGINLATSVSLEKIIVRSYSQLVVGQVNEEYETRE